MDPVFARTNRQLTLFEGSPAGARDGPVRHALDEASWVEHFHGWQPQAEELFGELRRVAVWEQRSRWMYTREVVEPRLTAEFPSIAEAPRAELQRVRARLFERYAVDYDSAWLNLYRDHTDSTSWHADRPACLRPTSIVPVLSLGATRRFLVRPRAGGPSKVFVV